MPSKYNWIRDLYFYTISPNQCALFKGGVMQENVNLDQEIIMSIHKNTRSGNMVLSLTWKEKAYDRLEWIS